ncbi:tetratricopeptide repeat protein [Candidatus Fermentibacterales bacterium]|nr:tetratricopeptide repeat protein [Candidatus Fermentibacterales bacterium]
MTDVSLKKKAHELLQKGRLDSALRAFEQLLKSDPEEASVHNSIGDVLLKMDRKEEALGKFVTAAELYLQDGLHAVALTVARKAIRVDPEFDHAHYLMGRCFVEQAKNGNARKEYVRFLKSKPDIRASETLAALRALIDLDPDNPAWVPHLARAAYVQKNESMLDLCVSMAAERGYKDHQKLVRMLDELRAELEPDELSPEEERLIESVHFDSSDMLESAAAAPEESDLEQLEEIAEEDLLEEPEPFEEETDELALDEEELQEEAEEELPKRRRLGEYFVADGLLMASDVLRALEVQANREDRPRLGDVLVEMGLVSVRQVREALSRQVADLRRRLDRNPTDALGFVELGNILIDIGDFYGAVEAYLKAADVYRQSNRDGMVFELLEGVLDICPESLSAARELVRIRHAHGPEGQARALYRLAVAFLLNESRPEAIAALEASVEADPRFEMARTLLEGIRPSFEEDEEYADIASILADIDRMFDRDAARSLAGMIREFREGIATAVKPEDYATHYDLGIAYMEMGLLREAISEFEQVLSCPSLRVSAREMLGRCFFQLNRYDDAEEEFQKGMSLAGKDHEALVGFHVHLAKVYAATGRTHQASQEMKAAKHLDPVLSEIKERLE